MEKHGLKDDDEVELYVDAGFVGALNTSEPITPLLLTKDLIFLEGEDWIYLMRDGQVLVHLYGSRGDWIVDYLDKPVSEVPFLSSNLFCLED